MMDGKDVGMEDDRMERDSQAKGIQELVNRLALLKVSRSHPCIPFPTSPFTTITAKKKNTKEKKDGR